MQSARSLFFASISLVTLTCITTFQPQSLAAGRQQIFPQSTNVIQARRLGAAGVAASIVSSQGTNRGLLINSVNPNSLAARMGLAAGDVLLNLNSRVVDSGSQADRILSETASGNLRCVFVRQGASGLQLYNLSTAYTNSSPPAATTNIASAAASSSSQTRQPAARSGGDDGVAAVPAVEGYMVDLVNADRHKEGLPSLSSSSAISGVARAYALDMIKRGFKGHVDPEGRDPTARGAAAGLSCQLGENFGWTTGMSATAGAAKINKDMMAEPAGDPNNHRGNILNGKYGSIGCGAAMNSKTGELIIVEDFSL